MKTIEQIDRVVDIAQPQVGRYYQYSGHIWQVASVLDGEVIKMITSGYPAFFMNQMMWKSCVINGELVCI